LIGAKIRWIGMPVIFEVRSYKKFIYKIGEGFKVLALNIKIMFLILCLEIRMMYSPNHKLINGLLIDA
jgi:hypothetical protein